MDIKITLASTLAEHIGGRTTYSLEGANVGEALHNLAREAPGLAAILWRGGEINPMLVVFRNDEQVASPQDLEDPLGDDDELAIITAVEGG